MKYGFTAALTLASACILPSLAYAEVCSGRWGGEVPTAVTFRSGDKLRYCYRNDCYNSEWVGDKSKKLVFRVGNGGATVEMVKRANGYRATWRYGNNSARADLTCK